jgi:hypothetical protein
LRLRRLVLHPLPVLGRLLVLLHRALQNRRDTRGVGAPSPETASAHVKDLGSVAAEPIELEGKMIDGNLALPTPRAGRKVAVSDSLSG